MRPHEDGNYSEYEMYGETKMTNDLLPDEIYVRRTTKKGLSAVRPESPLADRTVPNQASKLNRTKYIRGDLVSTPNKPAEVDLTEALRLFDNLCDSIEEVPCINGLTGEPDTALRLTKYVNAESLEFIRRHLATGKGGGDKVTVEVSKLLDIRNALCRDDFFEAYHHLYTLVEWQDPYNAWAEWEKVAPEKKLTPQPAATQPAAPAQIDTGELPCGGDPHRNGCEQCEPEHGCRPSRLERAILHCAQKKNAARKSALGSGMLPEKCRVDVDCLAVVIEAARAHLAKSKGGV